MEIAIGLWTAFCIYKIVDMDYDIEDSSSLDK